MTLAANLPNASLVCVTETRAGGALKWLARNVARNEDGSGTGGGLWRPGVVHVEACDWTAYGDEDEDGTDTAVTSKADSAPKADDEDESSESSEPSVSFDSESSTSGAGDGAGFALFSSAFFGAKAGPKPKSVSGFAPFGTVTRPTSPGADFSSPSPCPGSGFCGFCGGAVLTARSIRARKALGLAPGRSFHRVTNKVGGRSPTASFSLCAS